jgi:diaminopimelate decarboxylase
VQEGAGAEVVSGGELYIALKTGVDPAKIVYNGINKTDEELATAIKAGVGIINIESFSELKRIDKIAQNRGNIAKVGVRVNPGISPKTHPHILTGARESKFGLHIENNQAFEAYKLAKNLENVEIKGIHAHIGSQITEVSPYEETTRKIMDMVGRLKKELQVDLEYINLGGGFGIPYEEGQKVATINEFAKAIVRIAKEKIDVYGLGEPLLVFEPGRYIVGDTTILLLRVGAVKETPFTKFVVVDGGMNALLRPMLYDAYHRAIVANKAEEKAVEKATIVGPICESGDILAKDRSLPQVEEGDVIAILGTGAYGFSMSNQYNSHPRPAEVLVNNGEYELIREREGFEDLLVKQIVPQRLLKKE